MRSIIGTIIFGLAVCVAGNTIGCGGEIADEETNSVQGVLDEEDLQREATASSACRQMRQKLIYRNCRRTQKNRECSRLPIDSRCVKTFCYNVRKVQQCTKAAEGRNPSAARCWVRDPFCGMIVWMKVRGR